MRKLFYLGFGIVLVILILIDLFYKIPDLTLNDIFTFNISEQDKLIIFEFRLPKTISAILVGVALSISGFQMQTVFRNPLAGPYILGISSGASLGVALIIIGTTWFNITINSFITGNLLIFLSAFIGSSIVLILVLYISKKIKNILTILIFGVLFGYLIGSIVNLLQYFATSNSLKSYIIWTMGSLSNVTIEDSYFFIFIVFIGLLISIFLSKHLNLLMLGDDYAKTSGVNIKKSRILIFLSTSLLAGSVVAFCGPIGFIGITVPHMVKMFFKVSSALKIQLLSILVGSTIMLFSDIISQFTFANVILPINTVTAFFGIPIIFYIILSKKDILSV